ncbi:hypothetical protein SAMN02745181_1028 [Rubritalea squalenifaciens DSM 18772]|uniref:7-cyano-7-deazaguanine synthase (Queuosine biosynthesis) n=1 Tax=Rubritalea squalenifaciens DSM 18772 TaxID=1123071 RepID=A0A1M6EHA8_9BACT|nr:hypothetical protein [Rubritalea squalenifaciens]SHI84779.1 hypothetical protein SAMN02745181_1028 [Rubritalea squalenifaciens DSM 18772]
MIISNRQVTLENDLATISFNIESESLPNKLWFNVPAEYMDLVADSYDAALLAVLLPAMKRGEDIHIEGAISGKLWHNLMLSYQLIVYQMLPALKKVNITASTLSDKNYGGSGVLAGFSGGIDSYSVLHDYHFEDIPSHLKLTHLTFNNVGSHGKTKEAEKLFHIRYERVNAIAKQLDLPIIKVNSNFFEFYGSGLRFNSTDTIRNAAVALLLQNGIGSFMCASSYPYDTLFVGKSKFMACCDAISLPLLSTESLEAFAVGNEYTRVEKTLQLPSLPITHSTLDVCTEIKHLGPPINCGACRKCNITLITLEIAGKLDDYSSCFDLKAYKKVRKKYIRQFLFERRTTSIELVNFGIQEKFNFPPISFALSRVKHFIMDLFKDRRLIPRRGDEGLHIRPQRDGQKESSSDTEKEPVMA